MSVRVLLQPIHRNCYLHPTFPQRLRHSLRLQAIGLQQHEAHLTTFHNFPLTALWSSVLFVSLFRRQYKSRHREAHWLFRGRWSSNSLESWAHTIEGQNNTHGRLQWRQFRGFLWKRDHLQAAPLGAILSVLTNLGVWSTMAEKFKGCWGGSGVA